MRAPAKNASKSGPTLNLLGAVRREASLTVYSKLKGGHLFSLCPTSWDAGCRGSHLP